MRFLAFLLLLATPAAAQTVHRISSVVPLTAITITPASVGENGDHIQTALSAGAVNDIFWIRAGTYRLTAALTPKTGQVLLGEKSPTGERQTVLSGARVLTGWIADGGRWYVTGQTQEGTVSGGPASTVCYPEATYPRCNRNEEVFFNKTWKKHEGSLAATGPGEWFFDYAANRIYVGDDPNGQLVETSVTELVFAPSGADSVTVRSLIVEMFAGQSQSGVLNLGNSPGGAEHWLADDIECRYNHGACIGMDINSRVKNSYIHHNCGYSIVGAGEGNVVDGNNLSYNNIRAGSDSLTCGYNAYNGSSTKWVFTGGLIIRNNVSRYNDGPGFWLDIQNINALYEGNLIEFNQRQGIFHEISCAAVIRNNYINGNGLYVPFPGLLDSSGISVNTSPDVEIYGNVLVDNYQAITGYEDDVRKGSTGMTNCPTYELANLNVHDNITVTGSGADGKTGVQDSGDTTAYSANNHFEDNTYTFGPNTNYFAWNGDITYTAWMALGHDD